MLAQQVAYWNYVETNRHNLATEKLTASEIDVRNRALSEDIRHNKESESISWYNAQENARHNQASESIGWFTAQESARHNRQTESIGWYSAYETSRHNVASEGIESRKASAATLQALTAQMNANTNYQKVKSEIKLNQKKGEQINADISLKNEQARTQNSQRFVNWTSGAKNIVQSVTGISSEARSWLFWN